MREQEEWEKLAKVIKQWNNDRLDRLDLFEISRPDVNLVFHGVMRFYLENQVGGNVATTCLRFSSLSCTREVIETLSEKFRPDMKMLTTCYSLYEVHGNKERKLEQDERPLVIQLNWKSVKREGRFVLKRDDERVEDSCPEKDKAGVIQTFKRTLSRKEKKDKNKTPEDERGTTAGNEQQQTQDDPLERHTGSPQPGLPLGIELCKNSEEAFLSAVINYTNSTTVHFKLSPAYILYTVGRFALRQQSSEPQGTVHSVTALTDRMVAMTEKVFERQRCIAGALAFWMANASELLNFFKHDKDLSRLTQRSQQDLSHLVHRAYSCLIQCLQSELQKHLPTFLFDPEQSGPLPNGIEMVLNTLMNTMSLLRRCQVNPALTIQLFSQLLHFISAWLFNHLTSPEANIPGLRSHYWGAALRQRLSTIEAWAERQGLELAADCHLGLLIQATTLLTMNKYSVHDVKDINDTCFKLNSLQMKTLLAGYLCAPNEPHIPSDLIDAAVASAEASADNLIRREGRDVQLEESLDLQLPFLLPEGGYSCETVRGIPPGFREFLEPIYQRGLCSLTTQSNPTGDWTVFFDEPSPSGRRTDMTAKREPENVTITLKKHLNSGLGIGIVAAKGTGEDNLGIYVKSIVRGGPAEMNGGLAVGDQLLSVDDQSLVGLCQERAAAIMMQTGPIVILQVAKFAANYHGLEALLCEQRPAGWGVDDKPNEPVYSVVGIGHSEQQEWIRECRKREKDQMRRNRQLYRSDPNMTADFALEDRDEPSDPETRGTNSTTKPCADTFHREYLTLPTRKSRDKSIHESGQPQQMFKVSLKPLEGQSDTTKKTFMRRGLSQENLNVEAERPLLDRQQIAWLGQRAPQTSNYYSSFPIRSSVSSHDLLSENCSPTKQQLGTRAGVWKTPFPQQQTPTPSVKPIRIDIPVTRAGVSQSNASFTTLQSAALQAVKMSQMRKVNGSTSQGGQKKSPQAWPIPAAKRLPQSSPLSQQQLHRTERNHTAKPQVSITPRHVSFQEPPKEQKHDTGHLRHKEPPQGLLGKEVQELQAKNKHTAKENRRLQKLSTEWQFQKRLQEIQQRGDDENLDMMLKIQQLERRVQDKRNSEGKVTGKGREQTESLPSQKEDKDNIEQRPSRLTVEDDQAEKRLLAPENLTFIERQRLFYPGIQCKE